MNVLYFYDSHYSSFRQSVPHYTTTSTLVLQNLVLQLNCIQFQHKERGYLNNVY